MKRILYRVYTFLREHEEECQFFDGFGLLVQVILGIICLSILLLKRTCERPKRPLIIWFLDTFKQIAGQFTQHVANLLIADKIGAEIGIQCEWYLINLISDATLGTLFCYLIQSFILHVLEGTKYEYKSGIYTKNEDETFDEDSNHIEFRLFFIQVLFWILIVLFSKLFTTTLLVVFSHYINQIAKILLNPFRGNPKLKLIFVMIIFPIIFNSLQFWITDNIIKSDKIITDYSYFQNSYNENSKYQEENICLKNDNFLGALKIKEKKKSDIENNYHLNYSYDKKNYANTTSTSYYSFSCKKCRAILEENLINNILDDQKIQNSLSFNQHICHKKNTQIYIHVISENKCDKKLSNSFVEKNLIIDKLTTH